MDQNLCSFGASCLAIPSNRDKKSDLTLSERSDESVSEFLGSMTFSKTAYRGDSIQSQRKMLKLTVKEVKTDAARIIDELDNNKNAQESTKHSQSKATMHDLLDVIKTECMETRKRISLNK